MTKVSRRIIDRNLEKYIFEIFIKTITRLNSQREVENFIEDLLYPTEKIMLVKRLAIALMLTKGYTYDQIDHTLKVSRPTIMNVSRFLKYGSTNGYQKVIEQAVGDQKKEALFDKIEELLLSFSPPKLYQTPAYERKKRMGKELFKRKTARGSL